MQKALRVNNQIRIPEVQVIDEDGNKLGNMPIFKALELARDRDLDLVEVGPQMKPPIAKIMDYGKYMYQKEKQEKRSAKQKDQSPKTVKIGFKTGNHDLEFKSRQIDEFLKDNYPVKIELRLRGREKAFANMGRDKLENFLKLISEPYTIQGSTAKTPFGWTVGIKKDSKK